MKRVIEFIAVWLLQGIGIGIGLCIALPLAEAVKLWLS